MENTCGSCVTTFPELKVITSQLICAICYEFMKTPMITSCGHSYCSICIRSYISTKPVCPTCQSEVRDESLKNNLALENSIDPYLTLQTKLHEFCKQGVFKNLKSSAILPKDNQPIPREKQTESNHVVEVKQPPKAVVPSTPDHKKAATKQATEPQISQSPAKIPALFLSSPKSQTLQRPKTDIFTSPTSSRSSQVQNDFGASSSTQSTNLIKVPCPVCCVEIPERNINVHLDKCLTTGNTPASPSPRKAEASRRREPLKKLVYHVMSDKDIRKKLVEYGLSTKGNRTQIVNRLQRYTLLYNSECDSAKPRPVAEIRKQIEKDEEALTKAAPTLTKMVRIPKNADAAEIEQINKNYRTEHKSEFDELIRQVKEREKRKKAEPAEERTTSPPKSEEYSLAWVATASKRNRISDEDSDEFTSSKKKKVQTPKSRRIEDSDDDCFAQHSRENAKGMSERPKMKNGGKQLSPIAGDTSEDNLPVTNGSVSPVLNRSPNESKNGTKHRLRRKQPPKTVEVSSIDEDCLKKGEGKKKSVRRGRANQSKPARRVSRSPSLSPSRLEGGRSNQLKRARRVSRTPSLSPSRLEGLGEEDRDCSETPEMIFETSRRASQDSDSEMDNCNDNLSQLIALINETGDSSD